MNSYIVYKVYQVAVEAENEDKAIEAGGLAFDAGIYDDWYYEVEPDYEAIAREILNSPPVGMVEIKTRRP